MSRRPEILLAACAPVIWGSTYIVTTELLPAGYPLTVAALRAFPAGLALMLVVRRLPPAGWLGRLLILGALNFAIFWAALFVAAYRLPGGVAATLGAVQPMIVLVLAHLALGAALTRLRIASAVGGLIGVGLLVLGPTAQMDLTGAIAALTGAVSMACGVVLTRKWRPDVSTLTLTAWQLTAGGLLLLPVALWLEPPLPPLSMPNLVGFLWLGLFGAAISYFFWFRGIERLGPSAITGLGFLSPLTAVILGRILLGETLSPLQFLGAGIVLICAWLGVQPVRPRLDRQTSQS